MYDCCINPFVDITYTIRWRGHKILKFMNQMIEMNFAFLGSTRRERCHQCSKPKAGGFKERHKHSKNCQDLFQISVHKVNLLKKVSHIKSKRKLKLKLKINFEQDLQKQNVKSQKQCQVKNWEGSPQA